MLKRILLESHLVLLFFAATCAEAVTLELEPVIVYSGKFSGETISAQTPEEVRDAFGAWQSTKFESCMAQKVPFSCVLLEINREQVLSNVLVNNHTYVPTYTYRMRQTNVTVTESGTDKVVNEQGLNFLSVAGSTKCPDGMRLSRVGQGADENGIPMERHSCQYQQVVPSSCGELGNPINFLTGEKIEDVVDYLGKAGLRLSRSYLNQRLGWIVEPRKKLSIYQAGLPLESGFLCHGYESNLNQTRWLGSSSSGFRIVQSNYRYCHQLIPSSAEGIPVLVDRNIFYQFSEYKNGFRSKIPGMFLRRLDGGGDSSQVWELNESGGAQYYFDAEGRLVLEKKDANEVRYFYNEGRVERKQNKFGDVLKFDYSESGVLKQVLLPNGGIIRYQFESSDGIADEARLKEITFEDGTSQSYYYDNARFPLALTSKVDDDGNILTQWNYDEKGRAISNSSANFESYLFDYSDFPAGSVAVTNQMKKQSIYHFDDINGKRVINLVDGLPSENCAAANKSFDYYEDGSLKSKTDWEGNVTTYVRDELGREVSRTEASGTPQARTVTTEYHPTLNKPSRITEPGLFTDYTYDAEGRLLNIDKKSSIE